MESLMRKDKICSISEAAEYVKNGSRIAFGGFAVYQRPMAFVRELIRQEKKELTVVGAVNSLDVDMLAGAGCIKQVETSYVGLEKFGFARNYRRQVQNGEIKVIEYPELLSWDRFKADQEGLPFWTADYLGGTDIVNRNSEIKEFKCPITEKRLWAVPAAKADVVVIHAYAGDKFGNVQLPERHMLPQSIDITLTRSCKCVIVTVEKLLSTEEIMKTPHKNYIHAFRPTCVVVEPWGAHPTSALGYYSMDRKAFEEYVEAASSEEKFKTYLNKYVYSTKTNEEYMALFDREQIKACDIVRETNCKVVVAVGGGSTIDTAKAVAFVAYHGGKCWDYTERLGEEVKRPTEPGLPLIAVTTTSGTGSEVTPYSVINNTSLREKVSISNPAIYAKVVIIDPVLMANMPRKVTALTGIDAFSHCFESYIHTGSTLWSEMLSIRGMQLFAANIRECCTNGQNLEARTNMAWANTLGGMAIAISGCTVPHAIGQPVGAMTDAAHGATLVACYPTVLKWTIPVAEEKFAVAAEILDPTVKDLSVSEKAAKLPAICEKLFEELVGAKLTLSGFGLKEEEIEPLADLIFKSYTWNLEYHPKVPTKEELICLLSI